LVTSISLSTTMLLPDILMTGRPQRSLDPLVTAVSR
jgi:hypothetical protein